MTGSSLSLSGCSIDINVTKTGSPDDPETFGITTRDMTDAGNVTLASDAKLDISLSSNSTWQTRGICANGNIKLNGKLSIKQIYTGTESPGSGWEGVYSFNGTDNSIGTGADVRINMPNGKSPNVKWFKIEANGNEKINDIAFNTTTLGYNDFENSSCRIVQSDKYGGNNYSDFDYMAKAGATPVTGMTASVSPDTLSSGENALASAEILPAAASYKGVVWRSNSSLAAIDADGNVTAGSGSGKAVLTAVSKFDPFTESSAVVTVGILDPAKIYDVSATVAVPLIGEAPNSVSITVPSGFSVNASYWKYWDGASWQSAGASFEADKLYRVTLDIKENDPLKEYEEASLMAAEINGHPAAVIQMSSM